MNWFGNGCGNNSCIWIILLLLCCGGCGEGKGFFGGGDDNCCWWIILLLLCCGGCGGWRRRWSSRRNGWRR